MYKITWYDVSTGENKTLKVHTMRACSDVVATLKLSPYRNDNISFTRVFPRRVREIVIAVKA